MDTALVTRKILVCPCPAVEGQPVCREGVSSWDEEFWGAGTLVASRGLASSHSERPGARCSVQTCRSSAVTLRAASEVSGSSAEWAETVEVVLRADGTSILHVTQAVIPHAAGTR